jgi:3-hydroxymyristoyl/3-hydroxydecanoyl-(acyl carrier protein) dehydratase
VITLEALRQIPDDHPAFSGHFPGNPILPGAVLVEMVVECATEVGWTVKSIEAIKFGRSIRRGGDLAVRFQREGRSVHFACTMGTEAVASGKLRLAE